jgi:pseudaminic acid synthase
MIISNFKIDSISKVLIVAELSANHNGSIETAINTVKAAKAAGADAIKFQTYTPDTLTLNSSNEDFLIKGTAWDGMRLYDLYSEAYTPWDWFPKLFEVARMEGLICFSTPFDKSSVDFLEDLDCPAYKISSFEITDIPLIDYVAKKGKPILISTGIATNEDIELALETCLKNGNSNIILLKCTSSYPAPIEDAQLMDIIDYKLKYKLHTGLSDHTMGSMAPIIATSLGAKVIEKHFILNRANGGPDSSFSMEPMEFKDMVDSIRLVEKAIFKDYTKNEIINSKRLQFAKSLYVSKNVTKGEIISEFNIKSIRPGFGLHPKFLPYILGKKFKVNLLMGERLNWDVIE